MHFSWDQLGSGQQTGSGSDGFACLYQSLPDLSQFLSFCLHDPEGYAEAGGIMEDRDLDCRITAWCISAHDNGLISLVLSEKLNVISTGIMGSNVTVSLSGQYCNFI